MEGVDDGTYHVFVRSVSDVSLSLDVLAYPGNILYQFGKDERKEHFLLCDDDIALFVHGVQI